MRTAFIYLFLIAGWVLGQSGSNDYLNHYTVGEKLLIVRSGSVYPDQVTAVKSEKGIIIFDTGISPTLSSEYRKIIEREFDSSKITYAINTHHHFDHSNGNQVFKDAVIIAHDNCRAKIKETAGNLTEFVKFRRERYSRRDKLAKTLNPDTDLCKQLNDLVFMSKHMCDDLENNFILSLPDLTFSDELSINLNDMTLKLFHFPSGFHTNNDIIAAIPELGFIFTGDLIYKIEPAASFTSQNNLDQALKVLDNVINSCRIITNIITIHAGILPPERLFNYRNRIAEMVEEKNIKNSAVAKIENEIKNYGIDSALVLSAQLRNNNEYYLWEGDLIEAANKYFLSQKKKTGIELFELCAKLFPGSVNAHEWLGDAYYQSGNYKKAESAFEKALELNPINSFAADMIYLINNETNNSL